MGDDSPVAKNFLSFSSLGEIDTEKLLPDGISADFDFGAMGRSLLYVCSINVRIQRLENPLSLSPCDGYVFFVAKRQTNIRIIGLSDFEDDDVDYVPN